MGAISGAQWAVLVGTRGRNFLWILLGTKLEAIGPRVVVKNLSALYSCPKCWSKLA